VLERFFPKTDAERDEFFRAVQKEIERAVAMRQFKPVIRELKKFLKSIKNNECRQHIIETAVLHFLEEVDAAPTKRLRGSPEIRPVA
jgi:hypothetical protein